MPYRVTTDRLTQTGASELSEALSMSGPLLEITLWPHQSLTPQGFVTFIGVTAAMFSLPLLAVVGTFALWFLLPFIGLTTYALWKMIERNQKDRQILETLILTATDLTLTRQNPRGPDQDWQANAHWARPTLHAGKIGPVENYLTLKGGPREVELGAFLTPQERKDLHAVLCDALNKTR